MLLKLKNLKWEIALFTVDRKQRSFKNPAHGLPHHPLGLGAQQPTAGPAKRPSVASRLGSKWPSRLPDAPQPLISDQRLRTPPPKSVQYKRRMDPENPSPFIFLTPYPQHTSTGAGGGLPFFPAAGGLPAAVSGAARPGQDRGSPFHSLPSTISAP
jgi:hypothetical protein